MIEKINGLSKSIEQADFLPNILGEHYKEVLAGKRDIVLFGAGSAGNYICNSLKKHNVTIACFCDNNPDRIGTVQSGYKVIAVDELRVNYLESLIVISTSTKSAVPIKNQLLQSGFKEDKIFIPELEHLLFYTNAADQSWSNDDLQMCEEKIKTAYNLLADDKSKELFVNRISLTCFPFDYNSFQKFILNFADLHSPAVNDLFTSPRYDENYYYFNNEIFVLENDETFANVGALVGECALEFAKTCNEKGLRYKEIINFEPDPNNFKILLRNMNQLTNIKCLPFGLWSTGTRLSFSNPDISEVGNVGKLDSNGNLNVDVASLDELLPDSKISLIKMDIEGAETEALLGAAHTIRRNKPKLAISIYHKRNDIFELPLLIHSICPDYKFYLRHYSTTFSETVLFAIPIGKTVNK